MPHIIKCEILDDVLAEDAIASAACLPFAPVVHVAPVLELMRHELNPAAQKT